MVLMELDLKSAQKRISPDPSVIGGGFRYFVGVGKRREYEQVMSGIDRVRQALTGTNIRFVGIE